MEQYFEIYGTPIKMSSIKDFRIVQREYIYRPTYKSADKTILNTLAGKKYSFWGMQPYAAILDEKGYKSSLSEYKAKDFKESVGKDLVESAVAGIADKFNIKTLKYKKYVCVNQAGRTFTTYLDDVPALVMSADGKASDVHKDDAMYPLLGEPIAPAINIIHALLINTKEGTHIFYGNGVQLEDVGQEYERLKFALNEYRSSNKMGLPKKSIVALPHIELPKIGRKNNSSSMPLLENKATAEQLTQIKERYAKGELSETEYKNAIAEIVDNM